MLAELCRREKAAGIKPDTDIGVFMKLFVLSIIVMTAFSRTNLDTNSVEDGVLYMGALFYGQLIIMFVGMADMVMVVNRLPVSYKQRDQLLYPAWAFSIPVVMIRIPLSMFESLIWVCLTYFGIGFAPEADSRTMGLYMRIQLGPPSEITRIFYRRTLVLARYFRSNHLCCTVQYSIHLGLTYLNPLSKPQAILPEEKANEQSSQRFKRPREKQEPQPSNPSNHSHVKESLVYSAWLRLPSEIDKHTKEMFVDEVMELVELTPIADASVGLPSVNGLSTEQRKRLTIAVELVANPSIIFMDEPTSGLDARAAAIVMRTVRNTVDTGRTVVCTIHQPSIDIFESFDELLLLKTGGQAIYAGPLGHRSCKLVEYFQGIPGIVPIIDGYNPATWMLDISSTSAEARLQVDFAQIYHNSPLHQCTQGLIKELSTPRPGSKDLYFPMQYPQNFPEQCKACLWKQHRSYWRNPHYNAVQFLFTVAIALLVGTAFWRSGKQMIAAGGRAREGKRPGPRRINDGEAVHGALLRLQLRLPGRRCVGLALLFLVVFAISITKLNFQTR
ncbi:hypothetical protein L7F22_049732 [Adiantum nelumboides]|nr:hypothetical protein [Adiantum nelumboides]